MYMVEQKEVRASIMDRRGIGRLKGNVGRGQMLAIRRRGKMQVRLSKPGWRERNGYKHQTHHAGLVSFRYHVFDESEL